MVQEKISFFHGVNEGYVYPKSCGKYRITNIRDLNDGKKNWFVSDKGKNELRMRQPA